MKAVLVTVSATVKGTHIGTGAHFRHWVWIEITFLFSFCLHNLHQRYFRARGRQLSVCHRSKKVVLARDRRWVPFKALSPAGARKKWCHLGFGR